MTPFHFGDEQRRLFGVFEPALCRSGKERAVLLCHPMGNEQVFAYRTTRQLAARLAGAGFHVLRFDYFGTGDSYGDAGEGDIGGWCDDIETAIEELKDMTGVATVSLVGLRLGANLAAEVAARRREQIGKVVLWQPLTADELAAVSGMDCAGRLGRLKEPCQANAGTSPASPTDKASSRTPNTLLLLTTRQPEPREIACFEIFRLPGEPAWVEDCVVHGTIPADTLQHIVDWLK